MIQKLKRHSSREPAWIPSPRPVPYQGGQFEGANGLTGTRHGCNEDLFDSNTNASVGKVLAIGAEWSTYNKARGSFVSEAEKYHLETLDRAEILVEARGVSISEKDAQIYVKFDTGSPQYLWLNDAIAIGILQQTRLCQRARAQKQGYMVDMWRVTSPSY